MSRFYFLSPFVMQLSKVDSALGKEILRTELKQRKISNLDPRSASRTPAANKELPISPRHDTSMDAGKKKKTSTLI